MDTIEHYSGSPYSSLYYPAGNLDSIDKIEVTFSDNTTDFPSKAKVYLFHPHNNNGKLFIYHSGHCAGVAIAEDIFGNNNGVEPGSVIPSLLEEGYTVLAVPMLNYRHATPTGVICGYNNHDNFFLNSNYPYALSYFFKPLIASLNLLGRDNFQSIYMTGLSGGGWTTSIYPAIDSSIAISFPVAGSLPLSIRVVEYDTEQAYYPIFSGFMDYQDLYTLSCLAPARKMLQVNNRYDPCCNGGASAHLYYVDSVINALKGSQGNYKYYLDETEHNHLITKRALVVMRAFIQDQTASLLQNPPDSVTNGGTYFYDIAGNYQTGQPPAGMPLKFSLLKAPGWLSLDTITGTLQGNIPEGNILPTLDTISFKVEDSLGRFVLYNYKLSRERSSPYFFTTSSSSKVVYYLPGYSGSLHSPGPLSTGLFNFNNPSLQILGIEILNNSVIKLRLNASLSPTDSIAYNGFADVSAIQYDNGLKLNDFGFTKIHTNGIIKNTAVAGMIRFNTDITRFEYFNGSTWIEMN